MTIWPTCPKGKRVYATEQDAQNALRALNRMKLRGTKGITSQRAYECPWCEGWHLTKHGAA